MKQCAWEITSCELVEWEVIETSSEEIASEEIAFEKELHDNNDYGRIFFMEIKN